MAFGYNQGYPMSGYQQNPYQVNPYQQMLFQQMQQPVQAQVQPQIQHQVQSQNQTVLNGQMVDCIDAVKVKDVDMTGAPTFYPNINGLEIYRKQLQPDGTCQTIVYKKVDTEQASRDNYVNENTFNDRIEMMQKTILEEIEGIKGLISKPSSRGGAKND